MASDTGRNPLREVAGKVGVAWSVVSGLVSALAMFGVLSVATAHAITAAGDALPSTIVALGTVIAGITPIVGGIVAAYRTAVHGENHVTPVSDPRSADGSRLVSAGPFAGDQL